MYNSFTPIFYVNYFRLLQEMIQKSGGKMMPEDAEVTLQTTWMGRDYQGSFSSPAHYAAG
jgi:hypothetical protein